VILTTIWERYFLRELSKIFILFLCCFYGLYVLIDYSTHSHTFQHSHFSFLDLLIFYGYEFLVRMNVLIPFAILVACVKTLCSLNAHHELVALMASGIKVKRLLLPFIAFGLFFTALIYINSEIFQPIAMKYHQQLDHMRAKEKKKKHHYPHIQQLILQDGSSLIFQRYDNSTEKFFDVYWIRTIDDIYRIRDLKANDGVLIGKMVEHLERDSEGALILSERFDEKVFQETVFDKKTLIESTITPDALSLSVLKEKRSSFQAIFSEKEAILVTNYYYKLAIPWLCFLAVIAPIPLCITFSRTLPIFLIYAISLFGLVTFYLIMDASLILGERQLLPPALAIWVPFSLFFTFFGIRFCRST
jgi:lipopolysaccharide export system permease protein